MRKRKSLTEETKKKISESLKGRSYGRNTGIKPGLRAENPNEYNRQWFALRRIKILLHYGGNPPKCTCCGEEKIEFLAVDHENGGGNKHRKEVPGRGSGGVYTWIIKNNFPKGFRILCHNCNSSLGYYGYCPHKK